VQYLGVQIDESLSFAFHANRAASRGRQALGSVLFLRHKHRGLPAFVAQHLVHTLLLPQMLWASPAWWTGTFRVLHPLATSYHVMARWVTGLPPSTRIATLLTCANLPPLQLLLDYLSRRYAIRSLFLLDHHPFTTVKILPLPNHPELPRLQRLHKLLEGIPSLRKNTLKKEDRRHAAEPDLNIGIWKSTITKSPNASKIHEKWLQSLPEDTYLIYTDGSKQISSATG